MCSTVPVKRHFLSHPAKRATNYAECVSGTVTFMEWFLEAGDQRTVSLLREEAVSYLKRHCDPTQSDFDMAAVIIAELASNAVRHGNGQAWISLWWGQGDNPTFIVRNLGDQFNLEEHLSKGWPDFTKTGGRGLLIVSQVSDTLRAASREGGMIVSSELPVSRFPEKDLPSTSHSLNVLPHPSEATEKGFEKVSFLRALTVQLATTVEHQQGPLAAEAAVSQVAADIGGRMEDEFRSATGQEDGQLNKDQLGCCYTRLKSAIGGEFKVEKAERGEIVLSNTVCPFGDAVKQAPSLCRMTSGVFGGIAAHNSDSGEAWVALDERIAVGDPGCTVRVWINEPEEGLPPHAHKYTSSR